MQRKWGLRPEYLLCGEYGLLWPRELRKLRKLRELRELREHGGSGKRDRQWKLPKL